MKQKKKKSIKTTYLQKGKKKKISLKTFFGQFLVYE